ncbi:hypothetical protein MFIFM68171_07007 [Madurella fahalii]|uniref:Uncharacterized protein n=1 Tax=Madurella fahalii TaxID=1157608 RepID=A0ABQ0GGD3_9PEZI
MTLVLMTIKSDRASSFPPRYEWTPEKRDYFAAYMGQVLKGWANVTELAVSKLFDGSEESIAQLISLISDGKMIEGYTNGHAPPKEMSQTERIEKVMKIFYAYTIPAMWETAAVGVFVMDSGYSCNHQDPVTPRYLSADTAHGTWHCYKDKLYYLAHIAREAQNREQGTCGDVGCIPQWHYTDNQFSKPPGLDSLGAYDGITLRELVEGPVNTYKSNGRRNRASVAKASETITVHYLENDDITLPGFIRIPVD